MVKKLDFLLCSRGVLALLVILWHVEGYKGNFHDLINVPGRTAVILFFGMSGYLISYGFIFEKYAFNKNDLRLFYTRRVFRIMPLFLLISITTILYDYFSSGQLLFTGEQIFSDLFMIQFNHFYPLNSVFWTLGVEMQFYLLAPIIAYFTIYYLKTFTNQLCFYCILFGVYLFMAYLNGPDNRNILENLFHFYSGIWTCIYIKNFGRPKISNRILLVLIFISITLSNYFYHTSGRIYFTLGFLVINLSIPMLIFIHHNLNQFTYRDKFHLSSFFLKLGTISYGVYAWHPIVLKLMNKQNHFKLIFIVILTVIVSYLSYNFFEKPILSYVTKKKQS